MKISKNFSREEFLCQDLCGFDTVDIELIEVLEIVRARYGAVTINSGARCVAHNKKVGGGAKSQHLFGKAADFTVKDVASVVIFNFLDNEYPDKYGMGLYRTPPRVHLDVRPNKARWTG